MTETTRTVLLVILVAFIALAGGRDILRRERGKKPGLFRLTTAVYLALGLLLGEQGSGLLDAEMLDNLEPVLELALGWTGLLFGLQLEIRRLRKFPLNFFGITLFQSLATTLLVAAFLYVALGLLLRQEGNDLWQALMLLALVGAVSSPAETALAAAAGGGVKRRLARLAHYVTSLDPLLPVLLFSLMTGFYHSDEGGRLIPALEWTAASALIGLVLGLMFNSYARHRHGENELSMMIIAFTIFAGGIAAYLKLSCLFICVVMGAAIANLLPTSERIFRMLVFREKPILIVFLVLVGASWTPAGGSGPGTVVWVLLCYLAVRVLGKVAFMALARIYLGKDLEPGGWTVGFSLLGQGGMSVALVVNYQLLFGGVSSFVVVSVALLAVVASEAFGAYTARFALASEGVDKE